MTDDPRIRLLNRLYARKRKELKEREKLKVLCDLALALVSYTIGYLMHCCVCTLICVIPLMEKIPHYVIPECRGRRRAACG